MVFSCSRFADSGMLDLVVALAVIGFILVFGIVSRWLFPCPVCNDAFESSPNEAKPENMKTHRAQYVTVHW